MQWNCQPGWEWGKGTFILVVELPLVSGSVVGVLRYGVLMCTGAVCYVTLFMVWCGVVWCGAVWCGVVWCALECRVICRLVFTLCTLCMLPTP